MNYLIQILNALNNKKYPEIGHLQYGDIRGDGVPHKRVYVIMNAGGGVRLYHLQRPKQLLNEILQKVEQCNS